MAADGDRTPRGGATTAAAAADLFVCFTSRTSSSLMKLPSKSLFSPARPGVDAGPGPAAASSTSSSSTMLYTSLSRRLRHSGSLRGGGQASPMFPPAGSGKKKAALEEPSSPKVTCIGQVRVKTRKQGKKMRPAAAARSRSRRRSEGGSFREREQQRYWAALPISICEAVRALGAEFNCFQPCGSAQSWCASSASPAADREKADRKRPARSYCGAVFARWLVALNEGEGEEVVSHVLPEKEEMVKVEGAKLERLGDAAVVVEEEEGGYQVCVPPKNALLLMRCRSEPFRTASYTNRLWESPANPEIGRGEGEAEEEEVEEEENGNATGCEVKAEIEEEEEVGEEEKGSEDGADVEVKEEEKVAMADESENTGISSVCVEEEDGEGMKLNEQEEKVELAEEEQASDHDSPLSEAPKDVATDGKIQEEPPSKTEPSSESDEREEQEAIEAEEKTTQLPQTQTLEEEKDDEEEDEEEEKKEDAQPEQIESPEKTEPIKEEDDEKVDEVKAIAIFESEEAMEAGEEVDMVAEEVQSPPPPPPATAEEKVKEEEDGALPECLLLMLYEPKLSMEVSKETWVCSTDFFQWRPSKNSRPKLPGDTAVAGGGVIEGRRNSTDSRPSRPSGNRVAAVSAATAAAATACRPLPPPPPPSMATVVEEKLVKAAAYEPLVLTRCKSEPMRTSARLAPDACFWKSGRKLPQPPRRSLRADPVS